MNTVLQTHNLAIGYRKSKRHTLTIAENLNLSLQQGELVCLLGSNGVGKSTLMRTLAAMQPALHGHITLHNQDLAQMPPLERARRLSIVLTERPSLGLLHGYDIVALGRHPYTDWTGHLTPRDDAKVRQALKAVDGQQFANVAVAELSDGQRQKLMIARALAQESDVMLLDEPTAYLDLPRRVEMMQLLRDLAHKTHRAILLSTHDLDLALQSTDRLWLMSSDELHTGIPEALVLSGAFEATFNSHSVHFNPKSGTFNLNTTHHATVTLNGDSLAHTWTTRALQRIGFDVVQHPTATVITITEHDKNWQWNINHTHSYNKLEDLIQHLKHTVKKHDTV